MNVTLCSFYDIFSLSCFCLFGKLSCKCSSDPDKKTSRFNQLLGKKEKEEDKKAAAPKSLDDFMANISGKSSTPNPSSKKSERLD